MKALTIKQPWASLIAHGIKDVENRTWKANFRGRIYIHAAAKPVNFSLDNTLTERQYDSLPNYAFFSENYKTSAIIGEVDIVDCVINHPSIWAEKSIPSKDWHKEYNLYVYNWVLASPVLYEEPILNVKGKLSFWEYTI